MVHINEMQLEKIRNDYERFKLLGNSSFKAAYLATSENGFVHTVYIDSDKKIMTLKNDDECFLCMHSVEIRKPIVITEQDFVFDIE